jgi:NADPH:quinone reductase-like Zn-dependent oxidoreductase
VRRLTEKRGVDVVFEHTGPQTWPGSIQVLAKNGRLVTCGATSGYDARTDLRQVFYRHLNLLGSFMGSKADLLAALNFVVRGQLRAVVAETMPLRDARRAHEQMQNRAQFGKLVLVP